jgi:hypothetical protein
MLGAWKEGFRDANLSMLLDANGEVLASCMYMGYGEGWVALNGAGDVLGYAKTLGAAQELVH